MKKILPFLLLLLAFKGYSQTAIPSGDFENFSNVGSSTEEPQYWHSNKDGGGFATLGPQTCFRESSNPHGGSYCVRIASNSYFGTVVNGSCATGKIEAPSTNKSEGYIHTIAPTSSGYGATFSGRPDSLVFWYRYTSVSSDYPTVEARLHIGNAYAPETPVNSNHPDSTVNIIARATWAGGTSTVSGWTRVSIPFVYVAGSAGTRTPEYILITTTSSGNQTGGSSGSTLWLDDMVAIYNPTVATGNVSTGPYYVSAAAGTSISVPYTLTGTFNGGNTVTAELSDASGSFASPVTIGSVSSTSSGTISATLPAGTATGSGYRVRVKTSNPALTAANNGSNIQIYLVTNSIAPSTVQYVPVNTNGTQLTVTETPAGSSRQWQYSTTSGGPYQNFGIAQTGTTYTPNFAAAGTYYVVCTTTYPGGATTTSSEVQVIVVSTSIAPSAVQNILVSTNGNTLTVTETPAANSREWKYSTTSGGPYQSFSVAETNNTYVPNFNAAGTYYVVCVSTYSGTTATSNQVQINVVSNSIAPTAVQYVLPNTNGTDLTVTETPTASSRQWKYATTSGGPYQAFSANQTGTTYTPNFASAGTYYVVCISNFPGNISATSNEVVINVVANDVTPSATQNIIATLNGTTLTVNETPAGTSREWKYSTVSGGSYSSFSTAETGTTYTPNFTTPGTYYVVCITSYPGGVDVTSNEVVINVGVENSVSPATSQSLFISTNGNTLTVTETPVGTSREWKYGTTSGGPYQSFSVAETGTTYVPNFASAGSYYVVCVSVIDGLNATSNEVLINVGTATLATGTITGSPFQFSPSAPDANVSVPYIATGTFNTGNTFTAQLSDAAGSFASPVDIGSVADVVSGTINAVIPASTAAGTGYRIRVISDNPAVTGSDNGVDLVVDQFNNSIAPTSAQTILTNINGTTLTVTASQGGTQEWMYSATSGSGYQSFPIPQTGSSYTPLSPIPGIYYIVCYSVNQYGDTAISNEVMVTVVGNSIAPTAAQNLYMNVYGTTLTVTEGPVAATSREWEYATQSGGPYQPFNVSVTGTTYTPNFSTPGDYYVICVSNIEGLTPISNEVVIHVSAATLATGTITGSPFLFSPNAPDANVSVPYTTTGAFNTGNIFTAQLSDASGSFATPVNIGTLSAVTNGSISAVIPASTVAGTHYRIRVVADNPAATGTDNGVDLVIDQFHNSISPATTQTITYNTNGTALTVTASQAGTQEWKYSTTSGSGYTGFATAQTGATYTPNFATPGTYYVVCVSKNQYNDSVTSNEVQINVQNGSTITTLAVSGSPYYVSAHANVQVTVNFTSDVIFANGNVFTAQLSDKNGSFANPVNIGTLTATSPAFINGTIPNSSVLGSGYRIRVVSSNPAVNGSDNGTDLQIIPFEISVTPADTQTIQQNHPGTMLTANVTHPSVTYRWLQSQDPSFGFSDFSPIAASSAVTPQFNLVTTFYVKCQAINPHDTIYSTNVVIIVTEPNGIKEAAQSYIKAYWNTDEFMVDLSSANLVAPEFELMNINGQVVASSLLNNGTMNAIHAALPQGMYVFAIKDGEQTYTGKTVKK